MTAKTGYYAGDQLFHAIYRDNDPTTAHFMFLTHHKFEATHVINRLPLIIYEELLVNPDDFIPILGINWATMGIWDKYKRAFTDPNEWHN